MNWERVEAGGVMFLFTTGAFLFALAAIPSVATPVPMSVVAALAAGAAVAVSVALSAPVARVHASRGVPVGRTVSVWLTVGLVANLLAGSVVDTLTGGGMLLLVAFQGVTALLAGWVTLTHPELSSATVWKVVLAGVGVAVAIDFLFPT